MLSQSHPSTEPSHFPRVNISSSFEQLGLIENSVINVALKVYSNSEINLLLSNEYSE